MIPLHLNRSVVGCVFGSMSEQRQNRLFRVAPELLRQHVFALMAAIFVLTCVGTIATEAMAKPAAKTTVKWTSVQVPTADAKSRRESKLRSQLVKEARYADWGKHPVARLDASVKVTEFRVETNTSVVQVTCTATGKLAKGPTVRTHFSMGDHPNKQVKLESTVLTLVARGIVTRLSAIARNQSAKRLQRERDAKDGER